MKLSVIICTYNPSEYIFSICLEAIKTASNYFKPWEIIIVDNNSDNKYSEKPYLLSFADCCSPKLIHEQKQGLTYARLKGISEATGDVLVFIDDDNVISPDFFKEVQNISTSYPFIGAFSGQVRLLYEMPPPTWTKRYWGMLVYREFEGNRWSNVLFDQNCMPCGAGMCIRKEVAEYYLQLHKKGKRFFYLDRSKHSLLSGGDNDLAMCACDIGMKMGLFDTLNLSHYIPSSRFTLGYLKNLAYGIYYSEKILKYMRLGEIERLSTLRQIKSYLRTFLMKQKNGVISRACLKGASDAVVMLEKIK